jgi:hypothetical protein
VGRGAYPYRGLCKEIVQEGAEMYVQMNAEVARQRMVELHQQAASYRRTDRMAKGDRRADRRTFKMAGRRFDHPAPTA